MPAARPIRRRWRRPGLAAALFLSLSAPAVGQDGPQAPSPPDRFETARLVWTTLIAVDHANRTGNYTVLRDLGAPDFREANDAARLAAIFSNIRQSDLGLGRVVLSAPVYATPPGLQEDGFYRVTGSFPARPAGIDFDLLFDFAEGAWRLYGISLSSQQMPPDPDRADSDAQTPAE